MTGLKPETLYRYRVGTGGVVGSDRVLTGEAERAYFSTDLSFVPGEIADVVVQPGSTEEVAAVIYFLCTSPSSYVHGAEIHINGGQHV